MLKILQLLPLLTISSPRKCPFQKRVNKNLKCNSLLKSLTALYLRHYTNYKDGKIRTFGMVLLSEARRLTAIVSSTCNSWSWNYFSRI